MTALVLASRSATRRRMLEDAGVPFEMVTPDVDEERIKVALQRSGTLPENVAQALADAKALAGGKARNVLVIGSDQILEQADGSILSKATSQDDGLLQLRALEGSTHKLHAAASLACEGAIIWRARETVRLSMRPLSDAEMAAYLQAEWPHVRFNVGLYRIEGPGVRLFETIEGSHFAILGMPLLPLLAELRRRGLPA